MTYAELEAWNREHGLVGRHPDAAAGQLLGLKRAQVGLRLTEQEIVVLRAACAHWGWTQSRWVQHCALAAVARLQTPEGYASFAQWVQSPPTPVTHATNCRIHQQVHADLSRLTAPQGIGLATVIRWALLAEAPAAMQLPSMATQLNQPRTAPMVPMVPKVQKMVEALPKPRESAPLAPHAVALGVLFQGVPNVTTDEKPSWGQILAGATTEEP